VFDLSAAGLALPPRARGGRGGRRIWGGCAAGRAAVCQERRGLAVVVFRAPPPPPPPLPPVCADASPPRNKLKASKQTCGRRPPARPVPAGMGEKQIEVDRRLLRGRAARLRRDIEEVRPPAARLPLLFLAAVFLRPPPASCASFRVGVVAAALFVRAPLPRPALEPPTTAQLPVTPAPQPPLIISSFPPSFPSFPPQVRTHRRAYRERRAAAPVPVVALVGYTNAGKSSLLNALTGAGVEARDALFATLDPTTRRCGLPGGREALVTDTVGERAGRGGKQGGKSTGGAGVCGAGRGGAERAACTGEEQPFLPFLWGCAAGGGVDAGALCCSFAAVSQPTNPTPRCAARALPRRVHPEAAHAAGGRLPRHPRGDPRRLAAAARRGRQPPLGCGAGAPPRGGGEMG
jgi:hypothetical protein